MCRAVMFSDPIWATCAELFQSTCIDARKVGVKTVIFDVFVRLEDIDIILRAALEWLWRIYRLTCQETARQLYHKLRLDRLT